MEDDTEGDDEIEELTYPHELSSTNENLPKASKEECASKVEGIKFSLDDSCTTSDSDSSDDMMGSEDDDSIEPFKNVKRKGVKHFAWHGKPGNTLESFMSNTSKISSPCAQNCIEKCHEKFTTEKREQIKEAMLKETKSETKQAILNYLKQQEIFDLGTVKYHIGTNPVCIRYLSSFTNISEYIFKKVLKDFSNGVQQYVHFKTGDKQDSLKTVTFISWFENYYDLIGDKSPTHNRVDLPSYIKKIAIYNEYREQVKEADAISESQFYYLLKYRYGSEREDKRIPHIRIPKQNTKLFFLFFQLYGFPKNYFTIS